MQPHETRVLYLAHGRAGVECLGKLLIEIGIAPENLRVLTYARAENELLMDLCRKHGIVCSTSAIGNEDTQRALIGFNPDVVVSMHFRELIPEAVFANARCGGFNLHPSLLPQYRGCFSGVWAIIEGESTTGVTYHYLNPKFDDGRIVLQAPMDIADDETGHSIFNRLIDLGVRHFCEAFKRVAYERVEGLEQSGKPSYFGRALPYDGVINRDWSQRRIERFIRALSFPGLEGAKVATRHGLIAVNSIKEYQQLAAKL